MQHMDTFRRMMRLPEDDFALLTGRTPADFREAVWNGRSRMVFATPQVVRNDLLAKRMTLNGFGLLVFDECHRSVKEYAYTEIASQYAKTSDVPADPWHDRLPRLGDREGEERLRVPLHRARGVQERRGPDVKPYISP